MTTNPSDITTEPRSEKPLYLVRLSVNNILRLKAGFEIIPNGDIITLTGDNGAGKSSAINAFAMAVGGAAMTPEYPVRKGEKKGDVEVDLGDIVIRLVFNPSGKSLVILPKGGTKPLDRPDEILKKMWSSMCDPVTFIKLSETKEGRRKQGDILRKLVGLDFSVLDASRQRAYDQRTVINRDLAIAKSKLVNFPCDSTAPTEEILAADLLTELQKVQDAWQQKVDAAAAHNDKNKSARQALNDAKERQKILLQAFNESAEEIRQAETDLARRKELHASAQITLTAKEKLCEQQIGVVAALVDEDLGTLRYQMSEAKKPIEERITKADSDNHKVRINRRHDEIKEDVALKQKASEDQTEIIEKIESDKLRMLSEAKYPLPGLGFDDDGVLLDGIPFAQGSHGQQIEAAIAIGLELKPRLRVIVVRDASLFDKKTLASVHEMARKYKAQIIEEIVESDNPSAIEICDGEVVQ